MKAKWMSRLNDRAASAIAYIMAIVLIGCLTATIMVVWQMFEKLIKK